VESGTCGGAGADLDVAVENLEVDCEGGGAEVVALPVIEKIRLQLRG